MFTWKLVTIDKKFDSFQKSSIGKFLIEKVFFRTKGFYSVILLLTGWLIFQLSAFSYAEDLAQAIQSEIDTSEQPIKLLWHIADFFAPTGNLLAIIILALIIPSLFWIRNKELYISNSIDSLLSSLQEKSENILYSINTQINFNDTNIEIDRTDVISRLREELKNKNLFIISGVGGVGKTAIIKNLFLELRDTTKFYIFKASEFNINSTNELFKSFTLDDFIEAHQNINEKIIVIDSAEKLLDIQNTEAFKEALSSFVKNDWKIIFTTRENYLNDLNFQFVEVYKINPININIQNLSHEELNDLSDKFSFSIPADKKLTELIRNPFYLDEYLSLYIEKNTPYIDFIEKLWNKNIKKSSIEREQCFLKLAIQRANSGDFFIKTACEKNSLQSLVSDGVLGYETSGYFITHDIYEEWALEKTINDKFINKKNYQDFFLNIGNSLAIRRSFRGWVSEKLLLDDSDIKKSIEDILDDEGIESFWKDEILIAVLLSEYSEIYFELFKGELLDGSLELLKKLTFLLRIACKEVDDDFFKQIGLKNIDLLSTKYIFTKPKGKGWNSLIKFIYKNIEQIKYKNIAFLVPVLHEYNSKFKDTEITEYSSLIALNYYKWMLNNEIYRYRDGLDKILQVIIYGCSEIKTELIEVFDEVIEKKYINHNEPYYELVEYVLTKMDGAILSNVLPKNIIQLASLYWFRVPKKDNWHYSRIDVDDDFCIDRHKFDYYPASAYQTPIYSLLKSDLDSTINFILEFTNKTVECYVNSEMKNESEKVTIYIDENKTIEQYVSARLWNMYRGTQVSTHLLESIHMALEKFLLERAKNTKQEVLEYYLKYLLENSKSASISAVVTSIVLAFPDKTFNIALMLFKTKEFFEYDLPRSLNERDTGALSIGMGLNYQNKIYEDERLKTFDDKHRKQSLKNLFLNYQLFRTDGISEQESEERQKYLWNILDDYYSKLPNKSNETYEDKIWRMFLARMDKRKMDITTEKSEDGVLINFNPELEPDLKEFSKNAEIKNQQSTKYSTLYLWSRYKLEGNEDYKKYVEYENNYKDTLNTVKEFLSIPIEDRNKYILHESIPADVCSVLVRDNFNELLEDDKKFCKDVLLEFAVIPFQENYHYQISDGVESAISVLPILMNEFKEERDRIKAILFIHLFNDYPIGMSGNHFYNFALNAIHKYMWENNFKDAHSLLLGYLLLKPKYEVKNEDKIKETYENMYLIDTSNRLEKFLTKNEDEIQKVIENTISLDDINSISKTSLYILKTTFELIPSKTDNLVHKQIAQEIIQTFAIKILKEDRNDKIRYEIKIAFFTKLADFILNSEQRDIETYLKPFIDNFNGNEAVSDFFEQFIYAQDRLHQYDNFWFIWNLFSKPIAKLCENGDEYWYIDKIIKSYLFANTLWKDDITEWHTLKDLNRRFFKQVSENIGDCPSSLYSISKLLNGVGTIYLNDGIDWLSNILNKKDFKEKKTDDNTVYYLENIIRKFIFEEKENIKKRQQLKKSVLIILDYLISKQSAVAYMLRETIY